MAQHSKSSKTGAKRGIGALISKLIMKNDSLKEIAAEAKKQFPASKANSNLDFHVAWYAGQLRRQGKKVPAAFDTKKKTAKAKATKAGPKAATKKVARGVKK